MFADDPVMKKIIGKIARMLSRRVGHAYIIVSFASSSSLDTRECSDADCCYNTQWVWVE